MICYRPLPQSDIEKEKMRAIVNELFAMAF